MNYRVLLCWTDKEIWWNVGFGIYPDNPTTTASSPCGLPDALPYEYKPCARYCAPDDSSGVLLRPLPINPIPSAHCMPLPEAVTADILFRVVSHHPQCLIDRVFAHWLIRVMVAGKTSSLLPVISLICFRMAMDCSERGRYAAFAFCPAPGITHANNGFSRRGYRQTRFVKSISDQRAKRSSLERMNTCSISRTASRVSSRP